MKITKRVLTKNLKTMEKCVFEQMNILKKSITEHHDPYLLFEMNRKYRELEQQAKEIKTLKVYISEN